MRKSRRHNLLLVVAALWTGAANAVPFPLDSDSDGLADLVEATLGTNPFARDTDGDGKPDGEEFIFDNDLDLRSNALESSIVDSDHDGFNDENDAREDDACFPDATVGACDADGDGISNIHEWDVGTDHQRRDSDRDGFDDGVEGLVDTDLDGLIDALESNVGDCDDDGTPDHLDADSDDDGIDDGDEFPGDSDGDGKDNVCDDDDDGDGIATVLELFNGFVSDRDDDGIADHLDDDSDGDGRLDRLEGLGDSDGDGIPDVLDFDDTDGPGAFSDDDSDVMAEETPPAPVEDPAPSEDDEDVAEDIVDEEAVDSDGEGKIDRGIVIGRRISDLDRVPDAPADAPVDEQDDGQDDDVADVGVALDDHDAVDEAASSCASVPVPGAFAFAGVLALLRRRRR